MNIIRSHSPRALLLALSALGAVVVLTPLPLAAQPRPAIGLWSAGAQLFTEEGVLQHSPGTEDFFGFAVATGDFNGDGADDLVAGIPGNDCDLVMRDCGSAQVHYGYPGHSLGQGVTLSPHLNFAYPPQAHDQWGQALAIGDFDNDGYDDLAVGAYGAQHSPSLNPRGYVAVHHGSASGVLLIPRHTLREGNDSVPPPPAFRYATDFGFSLAVGDFDGDGHDDLAIGDYTARSTIGGSAVPHGRVTVAHGHGQGLLPFDGVHMELGFLGLPDQREAGDQFGYALAAGDFDSDGYDDLAIGVPGEDGVGKVLVVYGSPTSLQFHRHWYLSEHAITGGTRSTPGSRFGAALTVGDFNGDGYDDLIVGAPSYPSVTSPGVVAVGMVAVVWGTPGGLTSNGPAWLSEQLLGGSDANYLRFGTALATADFNGDGVEDLAVGTPGYFNSTAAWGSATVLLGSRAMPPPTVWRTLYPLNPVPHEGLIPDHPVGRPFYGFALAAGDFDANGFADLAIGAPWRDFDTDPDPIVDAGGVAVLYGQLFVDGFETGDPREWSAWAP